MELEELISNLDFENNKYFYHITSRGFGDEIIEEGLYLEDGNLNSTTIEIPKEMIEEPVKYCEGEYLDGIVKRQEMVIIGCNKGEEKYIVEKCYIPKWIEEQKFEFIIPSEYILGYIDLKTLEVVYNLEYQYGGKHV